MAAKKVTFADIAKYTNFSKTTISRYFNNPDSLTLENQKKIARALDELGYQENKLAKVLANGKSEFVGIIIPNLYLHYYSEMLNQILSSYSDYHYKFLVFVNSDKKELEQQYLDELAGVLETSNTLDTCREQNLPYKLILRDLGNTYETTFEAIKEVFEEIEASYPGKKKGVFLANDTYANIFLNLVFQKYGKLPEDYQIVGFDNSPIANEAILPITTVGQQIDKIARTAMELLVLQMNEMKKRKPNPLKAPVHKQITPVLIRRNTTD